MKYRNTTKKLKRLGCKEKPKRKSGSHRTWVNTKTGDEAVIPDWGNKDLKIGTLRTVIRQLGIDWETFKNA